MFLFLFFLYPFFVRIQASMFGEWMLACQCLITLFVQRVFEEGEGSCELVIAVPCLRYWSKTFFILLQ